MTRVPHAASELSLSRYNPVVKPLCHLRVVRIHRAGWRRRHARGINVQKACMPTPRRAVLCLKQAEPSRVLLRTRLPQIQQIVNAAPYRPLITLLPSHSPTPFPGPTFSHKSGQPLTTSAQIPLWFRLRKCLNTLRTAAEISATSSSSILGCIPKLNPRRISFSPFGQSANL